MRFPDLLIEVDRLKREIDSCSRMIAQQDKELSELRHSLRSVIASSAPIATKGTKANADS
jgi:hypothetical protein